MNIKKEKEPFSGRHYHKENRPTVESLICKFQTWMHRQWGKDPNGYVTLIRSSLGIRPKKKKKEKRTSRSTKRDEKKKKITAYYLVYR